MITGSLAALITPFRDGQVDRDALEAKLPQPLVVNAHNLERNRQGIFVCLVKDESCETCFVRVRPQVVQEIKRGVKLHVCGSCKRYLYHERLLGEPIEASDGDTASAEAQPAV